MTTDPYAGQGGRYERDPVTGERRQVEPPTAPPPPKVNVPICSQALLDAAAAGVAAPEIAEQSAQAAPAPARRSRRTTESTDPTE